MSATSGPQQPCADLAALAQALARLPVPLGGLIWDFDGTIVDSEPLHADSYRAVLRERCGIVPPAGFFARLIGNPEPLIWQLLREQHPMLPADPAALIAARAAVMQQALPGRAPHWFVQPLLAWAAAQGIPQLLVSAGNFDVIAPYLQRWQLASFFSSVSATGAPGESEAPKLERLAGAAAELGPGPVLIIEDSARVLQHAQARGLLTAAVAHGMNDLRGDSWDLLLEGGSAVAE